METKSIIVRVRTLHGSFRLNLAGAEEDLREAGPALDRLAATSEGPEDFLVKADPELSNRNIIIADIFDVGPRAPQVSIAERVRMLMRSRAGMNASSAYPHLRATFQIAEPEDIQDLLADPAGLTLVANYVSSVLTDLDEDCLAASAELRTALGDAAYFILGPDGE
jgi:hypothetical protein